MNGVVNMKFNLINVIAPFYTFESEGKYRMEIKVSAKNMENAVYQIRTLISGFYKDSYLIDIEGWEEEK